MRSRNTSNRCDGTSVCVRVTKMLKRGFQDVKRDGVCAEVGSAFHVKIKAVSIALVTS